MKSFVQAVILVVVASVIAIVSNAVASRDRKLVLPGYYPGATQVPKSQIATEPMAPVTVSTPVTNTATTGSAKLEAPSAKPEPPIRTSNLELRTSSPKSQQTKSAPKPVATPAAAPRKEFAPHPDKPYIEVSGDDAVALHSQGALTLDARRTSVYEEGHIAGARPFSVWESDIDEKVNKLYEERGDPREQLKPILVYCSGGDCEDSHMLAQKLWGVQFNNVYVYKDGFPDWQKRRGAIHTGKNP